MAWRGPFSRSFISTARAAGFRSSTAHSTPGFRRPPPIPRRNRQSLPFAKSRTFAELGGAYSVMPVIIGGQLASHLTLNVRAFCELSHGT